MNKYNAKKTVYNGVTYDSKLEAEHAINLDWKVKARLIQGWVRQVSIPAIIEGVKVFDYRIDFVVTNNDGSKEHHEVKGYETSLWKLKFKICKVLYPEYNFVIIKR